MLGPGSHEMILERAFRGCKVIEGVLSNRVTSSDDRNGRLGVLQMIQVVLGMQKKVPREADMTSIV